MMELVDGYSKFIGKYELVKKIGRGSYGEVWLCQNDERKQYVIKKISLHNSGEKERRSAKQECALLSHLKHPNIVPYRDSFEEHGSLFIVMGYCEGGDLHNRIKMQCGKYFDECQVVEWFVQISIALQYMHEQNVLHRDLKTQNIFLTRSKIIKVGDLGIARVLENESSMATTMIGTPYYMSPELFSNKPYNHKSDIWALGCVVYEIASLKHAFNAQNINSLSYKILSGKMPSMPRQYSQHLQDLVKSMLNKIPEKRPSARRILGDSYIRKHIALFLEATENRKMRVSSGGKERTALPRQGSAESAKLNVAAEGRRLAKEQPSSPAHKSAVDGIVPKVANLVCESAGSSSSARERRRQQRNEQLRTQAKKKNVQNLQLQPVTESRSRILRRRLNLQRKQTPKQSLPVLVRPKSSDQPSDRQSSNSSPRSRGSEEGELKDFYNCMSNTLNRVPVQKSDSVTEEDEAGDAVDGKRPSSAKSGPMETKAETDGRTARLHKRFEELHKECIGIIGLDKLHDAYEVMDSDLPNDEQEAKLRAILGSEAFVLYMGKIWQLKLFEDHMCIT